MTGQVESLEARWVRAARDNEPYVALLGVFVLLLFLVSAHLPSLLLPAAIVFQVPFLVIRVRRNGLKGLWTVISWVTRAATTVATYLLQVHNIDGCVYLSVIIANFADIARLIERYPTLRAHVPQEILDRLI